jgi:hypothetical protein
MSGSTQGGTHVELYVRSLAPRGVLEGQQAALRSVRELVEDGPLAECTVHICGREIPATPADTATEFGEFLCNRVAVFSAWADRNDYSLARLFDRRRLDSTITGEHRETLVMPVMALAEYEGPDLRFVAPCAVDGERLTVRDRLAELRAGVRRETTVLHDAHTSPPDETPPLAR